MEITNTCWQKNIFKQFQVCAVISKPAIVFHRAARFKCLTEKTNPKVNHSNRKGGVYISQNILYNNHSFFLNLISANLNPNEMKFET